MTPAGTPVSRRSSGHWRSTVRDVAFALLSGPIFDRATAAYVRLKNASVARRRRRSDRNSMRRWLDRPDNLGVRELHDLLLRRAVSSRVPIDAAERDFAAMQLLVGIARQPTLANALVLRGGAALRWFHVPGSRFARDLDFTVGTDVPPGFDDLVGQVASTVENSLAAVYGQGSFAAGVRPGHHVRPNVRALTLTLRFPWQHAAHPTAVPLEVQTGEAPFLPTVWLPALPDYGERVQVMLRCLCIEECVAQKLETLLTISHSLGANGGAARSPVIDYHDLGKILDGRLPALDRELVRRALAPRCAQCGTSFASVEDFFAARLVRYAESLWRTALSDVCGHPEPCRRSLALLKPRVAAIL